MTFGWRAMLAIEGDITYRFSISGVTSRHTIGVNGRVRQLFNAAWRETREIVAMASDGSYLLRTATLTLPVTPAVTGEVYAEVPFPTDAIAIYGVRCLVNPPRWYPLRRISFSAIHDFQSEGLNGVGYNPVRGPIAYCTRLIPDGVGSVETAGTIMLAPVPVGGSYALWYLQGWQDRTADTDTIPGMADWIEHAILGTLIKMSQPDGDSQKQTQIWMMERNRIQDLIESRAMKLDAGLPLEPRDARGDGYDPDLFRGTL